MSRPIAISILSSLALLSGCDPDPQLEAPPASPTPAPVAPPPALFSWDESVVDRQDGGLQSKVTVDLEGNPIVAYFAPRWDLLPSIPPIPLPLPGGDDRVGSPADEPLATTPELPGALPPIPEPEMEPFYELRFARFDGFNWDVEVITQVSHARGLSLLQTSSGVPLVAFLDADQETSYENCAANRLTVAARDEEGWGLNVMATSTPIPEGCEFGDPCYICHVVGEWPSLAEGEDGTVGLAYRRARYSTEHLLDPDSDQEYMELQIEGSNVTADAPEVIHGGEGGGFFGSLTFGPDPSGRGVAHLAYMDYGQRDEEAGLAFGLWYATKDPSSGEWKRVEVQPYQDWIAGPQVQLEVEADGTLDLLLYAWKGGETSVLLDLVLLRSTDGGETWTREYLETDGRSGSFPSMAISDSGQLAVSYYLCGASYDKTCDATRDGLRLAVRDGEGWQYSEIQADAERLDGTYTALTFLDEMPVVAARTQEGYGPDGRQQLLVFFGDPLSD